MDYFVDLYVQVSQYETYNFNGARIPLCHSNVKVDKIRQYLPESFDNIAVIQYLEFGFPLGLIEDYILQPTLKNHTSSYVYYSHIDKFISTEISNLAFQLFSIPKYYDFSINDCP